MPDILNPNEIRGALAEFNKAITETNVTNGALVREDLQEKLVIAGPMETPLRNRFNRIAGNGNAHAYYRLKPNADVTKGVFYGTTPGNAVFPKGGLPTDTTETYEYVSNPYANLGDIAQVTFQDQAQGKSFTDLMAQRTWVKGKNAAQIEEYFILWGNSAVTQAGGGNIFDGIIKQIGDFGGQIEVSSDGKLTLDLVSQLQALQDDAGGSPRAVVMDGVGRRILTKEVNQILGIRQTGGEAVFSGMSGGVKINSWDFGYGDCDWIKSRYLVADAYSGKHYFISIDDMTSDQKNDGNVIQMVDVDPMHWVELAIVATAWRRVIYETCMLMISAPTFQGMITNLTYSGQ